MEDKKGQMTRILIIIILAVIALAVFLLFYTGQWEKLVGALTGIEEGVIADIPPANP